MPVNGANPADRPWEGIGRKRANTASSPVHPLSPTPTSPKLGTTPLHPPSYPTSLHAGSLNSIPNGPGLKHRSVSELNIGNLKTRTLSASNLHALSQGNLSLKLATPARSYNDPRSQSAASKTQFEIKVRAYYHQLTVGCGNVNKCRNKFCFSCIDGPNLQPDLAAIMAIQLASRTKTFFCVGAGKQPPRDVPYINESVFQAAASGHPAPTRPFLHSIFTASPFQSLYGFVPSATPKLPRAASGYSLRGSPGSTSSLPRAGQWQQRKQESRLQFELSGLGDSDSSHDALGLDINGPAPLDGNMTFPPVEEETGKTNDFAAGGVGEGIDGMEDGVEEEEEEEEEEEVVEGLSLTYLTKDLLQQAIDTYSATQDDAFLLNTTRTVFSSSESLSISFRRDPDTLPTQFDSGLDIESLKDSYAMIMLLEPKDKFQTALVNALEIIIAHLANTSIPASGLAQLMVILEFPPLVSNPAYLESMVRLLARIISELPESSAKMLRQWWSRYPQDDFARKVEMFQQYVSVHHHPNQRPDTQMINALSALQLLYEANELAAKDLEERVVDASFFYNDSICRKIDFKEEYNLWKRIHGDPTDAKESQGSRLSLLTRVSFFDYPFLFDPASKSRILHIDAIVQMSQVFEDAFVRSAWVFQAQKILEESSRSVDMKGELKSATCPYLVLEIRREHLMQDTLAQLKDKKTMDLKKPLKIKYVGGGEEGLDMGGVQKEFFQMIVEHIFNPEVGMFVYNDETRQCWINAFSMESQREFELVGLLLGLAIYNGVILDVRLPLVLYRKLLGHEPTLADLKVAQPRVGKSLQQLLDWDPAQDNVEDIFCYTFQISERLYGEMRTIDLKQGGGDIPVTNENRAEFVRLYVDYLLNRAVQRQFTAFSRGFHRVCGGPALSLCTAEELELLICGSPDLDFDALEQAATYDDGYSADHPLIKEFWKIVHQMDNDQKKQLLNFVTGSDRVPIAGLSNMAFIIQRNGPDSHRLPTALTCFSRLLLPEYSSGAKLKEKMFLAMENGRGFGLV